MAATRTTLKQYFKKYATPTEEQFAALIDAFVHKDEDSLTQSKIDGLSAALESKVSSSDLASAVATAVVETLQGGNIEVTPAAHQHAIADVEDLQAFVTKVNNFLESADVSDETINRWVEIETFLTGITDQETLTGLLLQLKAEILAEVPQPQEIQVTETSIPPSIPLTAAKELPRWDVETMTKHFPKREPIMYIGRNVQNFQHGLFYEPVDNDNVDNYVDVGFEFSLLDIIPVRFSNAPASYEFPLPLSKFPFGFSGFVDGKYGYPTGSGSFAYEVYLSGGSEYQEGDYSFWTDGCCSYPSRHQISSPSSTKFAVFVNTLEDRIIIPDQYNSLRDWYNGVCDDDGNVSKTKIERVEAPYTLLFIPHEGNAQSLYLIGSVDLCTCPDTYNYGISEKEATWQPIISSPVVS